MPPRKYKVNHHSRGKHVSSFDEVKARNSDDAPSRPPPGKSKQEEEEEEQEEEQADDGIDFADDSKKSGTAGLIEVANPNDAQKHVDKDGVAMTRKQREELDKAAARRRYEELHKQGKTDEAKADLKRLEEVKKRREEAAKAREAEEKAEQSKKEQATKSKSGMSAEVREALGGEDARLRGARSKANKDKTGSGGYPEKDTGRGAGKDDDLYVAYASTKPKPKEEQVEHQKGSMEATRAAEEDFM